MFSVRGFDQFVETVPEESEVAMTGAIAVQEEDPRAAALGVRLRAWFAALAGRPAPEALIRHVEALDASERSRR